MLLDEFTPQAKAMLCYLECSDDIDIRLIAQLNKHCIHIYKDQTEKS